MTTPAGKRSDIFKKQVTPYVYLLPTIILMLILLIIPIIMVIRYSFFDNVIINKNPTFVGLENFAKVLTDPTFLVAIKNTLYFVIISIIASGHRHVFCNAPEHALPWEQDKGHLQGDLCAAMDVYGIRYCNIVENDDEPEWHHKLSAAGRRADQPEY